MGKPIGYDRFRCAGDYHLADYVQYAFGGNACWYWNLYGMACNCCSRVDDTVWNFDMVSPSKGHRCKLPVASMVFHQYGVSSHKWVFTKIVIRNMLSRGIT